MNSIDFLKYQKFPTSSETWDFMQTMLLLAAKTASLGGTNYILEGCTETGTNVAAGTLVIAGEILPFAGGTKSTYVVISETKTSVQVYDTAYSDLYATRKVIFGTGTGQIAWSSFKQVPTLLSLDSSKAAATDLTTHTGDTTVHITAAERTAWNGANAPIGSILMWPGDVGNIPTNWKLCDGSTLNIADYAALYSVLGNKFGGTTTTFALPPTGGRFVVGYSASDSDYNVVGKTGGEKTHVLTIEEMPSHSHDILYNSDGTDGINNGTNLIGTTDTAKTELTGDGAAHENRPPYMAMPYIIKVK